MEFENIEQAYECLKEWQTRLFLNDWIIKLNIIQLSEMSVIELAGENDYQEINRCAVISIGSLTENSKNRIGKANQELTLVHELLHCKFVLTDGAKDTVDARFMVNYEHVLVEQIAKSLIMAKYNLPFEWFKNFK